MKFCVTMKTPDALYYAIEGSQNSTDEAKLAHEVCKKWFQYGEVVTLEIDTEAETCIVL